MLEAWDSKLNPDWKVSTTLSLTYLRCFFVFYLLNFINKFLHSHISWHVSTFIILAFHIFTCVFLQFHNREEEVMELLGSTLTTTYARPKTSHFLPAISTMASSYRNTQPALGRSPSANMWRTNSYYKSSSALPLTSSTQRDHFDLVRANTAFYPSNRTMLTNRYTPDDWYKSNHCNYRESESSRKSAERLRTDTIRLMQDREQLTRRTQENTSKNIAERVNDIVFWRSELSHEIDNMVTEIAALSEVKKRLERALAETEGPLKVRMGFNSLHWFTTNLNVLIIHLCWVPWCKNFMKVSLCDSSLI